MRRPATSFRQGQSWLWLTNSSFAVKRIRSGISFDYPMLVEVPHLYAAEYQTARRVLAQLNESLSTQLPAEEAVAITLHLVNASFATEDLSTAYQMTEILRQLFSVLESALGDRFDRSSVHVARFVTHLRYFFVRMHADSQFELDSPSMTSAIRADYPEAYDIALKLKAILELRLGKPIKGSELTYLTIHIARLSTATQAP